jgi:serine/threonine-protein kinase
MTLSVGTRLGPYQIVSAIGAGGMGEVYKARDTRLDRTVAVKVLSQEFQADPTRRERFDREARAVAALNHSHICALHDVGEALSPEAEASEPVRFLVMEYLEGQTLAERLLRGPLSPADVVKYSIEIAEALDHAHRRGLIHRDLKPANVMLTKGGGKLLDFGLSKQSYPDLTSLSTISGAGPLTAEGVLLGTYPYMAPEQLAGRDTDARSDIFAFGAMVYEMATGRRAFEGSTAASVIGAILHTDPPPVSVLQPLAPSGLDRIVSRCLAKDPDDRWQTARDVMLELKWVAESKADAPVHGARAWFGTRARTWGLFIGMALLSLLGLVTGVSYLRRSVPREATERVSILLPSRVMPAPLNIAGGATISTDDNWLSSELVAMGNGFSGFVRWIHSTPGRCPLQKARPTPSGLPTADSSGSSPTIN